MMATIMGMIIIVEVGFFIVLAGGSGRRRQRLKFVYCGAAATKQNSANIK